MEDLFKMQPIPSEIRPVDKKFEKLNKKFKGKLFKPPFTMLLDGMIGSGKTSLAYNIVHKFYPHYFDLVIIYSGTMDSNEAWLDIAQKVVIVKNDYDDAEFNEWFHDLEKIQNQRKEERKRMYNVMVIFDDMITEEITKRNTSTSLETFLLNIRHYNGSCIISTQSMKLLSRTMRINTMHFAIFRVQKSEIKRIAEEHANALTEEEFQKMLTSVLSQDGYPFLMIDYKAPPDKRFRYGIDKTIKI